jgi:hypothetical protein
MSNVTQQAINIMSGRLEQTAALIESLLQRLAKNVSLLSDLQTADLGLSPGQSKLINRVLQFAWDSVMASAMQDADAKHIGQELDWLASNYLALSALRTAVPATLDDDQRNALIAAIDYCRASACWGIWSAALTVCRSAVADE